MTTRVPLVLLSLAVAATLAACGGGGHKVSPPATTTSAADQKAAIKSAYEKFFSSKTPESQRVELLQNGQQFEPEIKALAQNPLASNTSATVSSVTLQGPNTAKVVYKVNISGASLGKQTGTAVRENGTWKVGDASLCKLIALGGTTPSVCKS